MVVEVRDVHKDEFQAQASTIGHLRIVYAAGPGDVIGTFRAWVQGHDDPSQVSMTYSGQFYDVCQKLRIESYTIASSRIPGSLQEGSFTLAHRPIPFERKPGLLYHFGQVLSGLRLLLSALRFRAHGVVVSNGTTNWFSLILFQIFGIRIIPSLHCVLWAQQKPLSRSRSARIVRWLDGWFFRRIPSAILSASHDITHQVEELTAGRHSAIFEFLPTYRREEFANSGFPPSARRPFRVLYAGRIERNKGVFDLLEIARRFASTGRDEIVFDLCGSGSALELLRMRAIACDLQQHFRLHGHCSKQTMRRMFARSHIVVVPTTSDFVEGFNQVVVEGVLSGRPVITSNVCPALDYVREGVVEVSTDDINGYGDAILKLCDDLQFYEAKRAACAKLQLPFYNPECGWGAALRRALLALND